MSDDHLSAMREHLTTENQDAPGYLTWKAPSQLAALTDTEVLRLYRKMAAENRHNFDRQVELELMGRFTIALKRFSDASEKASGRLEFVTWVLVALTVVIAAFTVALFFD